MGIEPTSQPWQGHVLTVVLHLHIWRGQPDLNRRSWSCSPMPYQLGYSPMYLHSIAKKFFIIKYYLLYFIKKQVIYYLFLFFNNFSFSFTTYLEIASSISGNASFEIFEIIKCSFIVSISTEPQKIFPLI